MSDLRGQFAVVTGASSGIGRELARIAAAAGCNLLIAADEPLDAIAAELGGHGAAAETLVADLGTLEGVDRLVQAIGDRPVDLLFANAGRGLGHAFLDQDVAAWRRVVDTNITGTVYLIQKVAKDMAARGTGRILVTGSIAGLMPGTFQAVYNGSKAFLDSFSIALRHELQGSGVSVTCLMPGATDTNFFETAGMMDTKFGQDRSKEDPALTARHGWDALMRGDSHIVSGFKNKIQAALTGVIPMDRTAEMHRGMAAPGTGRQ